MPVVFPVHPRTRAALERAGLLERAAAAARLTSPLGYLDFTALLVSAAVCLTDSGGVQKEAYLHRVPCMTLRDTSEWVETVATGWNQLAGPRARRGGGRAGLGERPPDHPPLYGDGDAAGRIAAVILRADSIPTACQRTSESSALATWACRWPSRSPGRAQGGVLGIDQAQVEAISRGGATSRTWTGVLSGLVSAGTIAATAGSLGRRRMRS